MEQPVMELRALPGGCIGAVYHVVLEDWLEVVAKVSPVPTGLDLEGRMLEHLALHGLPTPQVLHADPALLVMTVVPGSSSFHASEEEHAAELLATLHAHTAPRFGFEEATLIGGLHQPNPWTDSWRDFFAQHRLLYMAREAERAGRLSAVTRRTVEQLAEDLDKFLTEPPQPALLHGDVWTTNVLAESGHVTGFLDPAVYYGHPEIELAFIKLFHTFSLDFFNAYDERSPIAPGFFEERCDLYNLYPLLVHARLFGGGYENSVVAMLHRFGYG